MHPFRILRSRMELMYKERYRALLFIIFISSCNGCESSSRKNDSVAQQSPAKATRPSDEHIAIEPEKHGEICDVVGYAEIPTLPHFDLVRANRNALAHHRGERFEESHSGFTAIVEEKPDYNAARFNLACALSRLGRLEEAMQEIKHLLCRDLPTYFSKVREDPDLQALRELPQYAHMTEEITTLYRNQMQDGKPLIAWRQRTKETRCCGTISTVEIWTQSGIWQPREKHFIPVGPRAKKRHAEAIDGQFAASASFFDVQLHQVVNATYSTLEGDGEPLHDVRVQTFRAPQGELLWESRLRLNPPIEKLFVTFDAALFPEGTMIVNNDDDSHWMIREDGTHPTNMTLPKRYLSVGVTWWRVAEQNDGYRVRQGKLETPDATIALGPGHRTHRWHHIRIDDQREIAVVSSIRYGECEFPFRFIVDVVHLKTHAVHRLLNDRGQVVIEFGSDGALYLQTANGLRRYSDPMKDEYEILPDGIGLSSVPWLFDNFHC